MVQLEGSFLDLPFRIFGSKINIPDLIGGGVQGLGLMITNNEIEHIVKVVRALGNRETLLKRTT